MACDVCDKWEHVGCLRHSDKLSKELYEALKGCRSRAILYVCTRCRAKGSIIKCLHEYEVDSACAHEQRLASAQRTDELSEHVRELREEKQRLLDKQVALEKEVQSLTKQLVRMKTSMRTEVVTEGTTTPSEPEVDEGCSNEVHALQPQEVARESSHSEHESIRGPPSSSHSSSSEGEEQTSTPPRRGQTKDPHPPGFRHLVSRVEKFSGQQDSDDFELWLMDFNETGTVAGLTNNVLGGSHGF